MYKKLIVKCLMMGWFFTFISVNSYGQLYKISGNELNYPVFLFGTIHALSHDDFIIRDYVIDKLNKSDLLILEAELTDEFLTETAVSMLMLDKNMKDLLTDEEYDQVSAFFREVIGVEFNIFNRLKPIACYSFILYHIYGNNPASYDRYIHELAKQSNKRVMGLETTADHIGFFEKIPIPEQIEMMMNSVSNYYSDVREPYQQMIIAYLAGDMEKLSQIQYRNHDDSKTYLKVLLEERNYSWIKDIPVLCKDDKCFVAVGASHLGGEKGLINIFRQFGYEVDAISN